MTRLQHESGAPGARASSGSSARGHAMSDHDAVALLEGLVRIPSVSGDEARACRWLVERMRELGYDAEIDDAGNAVGVLGDPSPDAAEIVLLGHIDTVPGWIVVRRDGEGEDARLSARGAVDAKGPLCAFVAAAQRAAPALRSGVRLVVAGAVEEECATSKGARHLSHTRRPRACIIGEPSRWDGVTLGYKGRLLCHSSVTRDMAHTARPEPGAAEIAVSYWESLRGLAARLNEPHDAQASKNRGAFHAVQASLRSIRTDGDGLRESAEMTVGFRLPPGLEPSQLETMCRELAPPGIALNFTGHESAHLADRSGVVARSLVAAIREAGGTPTPKLKTGTSDMNVVAPVWGCPIAAYGPGDSALDHTPDEHIVLAEYLRAISVLESALVRMMHEFAPAPRHAG